MTADELKPAGDKVTLNLPKRKARKQPVRWVVASGLCLVAALTAWFFFSGPARFLFNWRLAEAIPTEKSIAVLPFDNISPNKDVGYFADGVQEEILNNLAKVSQLSVISRTSVMQYRGDAKRNLRQIAETLGVANIVEGTVQREANRVRVNTELIDARTDRTLWADHYDRDLTDIFAIQSEVAQTVAAKLQAQLTGTEQRQVERKPTDNLAAYELYLQGKSLIYQGASAGSDASSADRIRDGIAKLEQATKVDPKFALAFCAIADAYDRLYIYQQPPYQRCHHGAGLERSSVTHAGSG